MRSNCAFYSLRLHAKGTYNSKFSSDWFLNNEVFSFGSSPLGSMRMANFFWCCFTNGISVFPCDFRCVDVVELASDAWPCWFCIAGEKVWHCLLFCHFDFELMDRHGAAKRNDGRNTRYLFRSLDQWISDDQFGSPSQVWQIVTALSYSRQVLTKPSNKKRVVSQTFVNL